MPRSISSLDHYPHATDDFHRLMLTRLVAKAYEQGDITETLRDYFLTKNPENLDELDECYKMLVHAIDNKSYYKLLARIEKADTVIPSEPDPRRREYLRTKRDELVQQLERMELA